MPKLSEVTGGVYGATRLGNYERGEREPTLEDIAVLGKALGVSASYLAGLTSLRQALSSEETSLIHDFRALSERMREEYRRRIHVAAITERDPVQEDRLGANWKIPKSSKQSV